MQKTSPFRNHALAFASLCFCWLLIGCDQPAKKPATSSVSVDIKDRPPIRIFLFEHSLEEDLKLRWSSFSEQRIEIEKITIDKLTSQTTDNADVWIYPSHLIGQLIALDGIASLPTAAAGKLFDEDSSAQPARSVPDQWPARWRASSRFGSATFALPLGAPQLVAITRNFPLQAIDPLDDPNSTIDDRTAFAAGAWKTVLQTASAKDFTPTDRLNSMISALNDEQKNALVDRYLWIASTTNAKRRGLFDLNKVKAKLSSPDFVLAADVLSELVRLSPDTLLATHHDAWKRVVAQRDDAKTIAIAYPPELSPTEVDSVDPSGKGDAGPLQMSKVIWNPSVGLLASVGKKTRQTSVASQFLAWLSEADQRNALVTRSSSIERWPSQTNSNMVRSDYRDFQNLNNRDSRFEQPTLAIRFQSATQYRLLLADCLVQILQHPNSSKEKLEECAQKWNALTESIGVSVIRPSIEQATGFSQ